jgi:hypothetical protein
MDDAPLMVMYAVRSKDGKWLRRKGYGGCGASWVDDLKKARIYPKPGPARAQVTFWSTKYPSYGTPELVELNVTSWRLVSEDARIQKLKEKREAWKAAADVRRAQWDLERAEKKKREADEELARLQKAAEQANKNRLLRVG